MQELKEFLGQSLTPDQKKCEENPEIQMIEEKRLQLQTAINQAAEGKKSLAESIKTIIEEILINIHAALQSEENITESTYSRHDVGLYVKRHIFNIKYPESLDKGRKRKIPGGETPTTFSDIQRAFREVLTSIGILEKNSGDLASITKIYEKQRGISKISDKLKVVISKGEKPVNVGEIKETPKLEGIEREKLLDEKVDFDLLHMIQIRTGHTNVGCILKRTFQMRHVNVGHTHANPEYRIACEHRTNRFALEIYNSWHPKREVRKQKECFNGCPYFGLSSYAVLEAYLKEIGLI